MQDTPSSALGRACPVQGPFEIQAPPSHHWFTRRGQPSCRARRAVRSSSLGPDSLQPPTTNTAETPRVWLTSPAEPARKGLCQSAASLWTARGGIAKGWDTSWPWPRPVFSGGWTRSRSGIGSRWPIVSVARLSETASGPTCRASPAISDDGFMRGPDHVPGHGSFVASTRALEFPHHGPSVLNG